jgi:hypothetical protein
MNKFLERLNSGEILVADGATGLQPAKDGIETLANRLRISSLTILTQF